MTLIVLIIFLFTAIFFRLIYLQVVKNEEMQVKALDQWTRDVPVTGERGDIYRRMECGEEGPDKIRGDAGRASVHQHRCLFFRACRRVRNRGDSLRFGIDTAGNPVV